MTITPGSECLLKDWKTLYYCSFYDKYKRKNKIFHSNNDVSCGYAKNNIFLSSISRYESWAIKKSLFWYWFSLELVILVWILAAESIGDLNTFSFAFTTYKTLGNERFLTDHWFNANIWCSDVIFHVFVYIVNTAQGNLSIFNNNNNYYYFLFEITP